MLAGLTSAAIVLPQGVAFATIAGLPPQYGLYAAIVPALIAALFGSSWHLVSGPTNAISLVVFASVSKIAEPGTAPYIDLVLTLTFLTGLFQLGLGLARMGVLVNFISHTVVVGFTSGAAILIFLHQLNNFFGVDISRGESVYGILKQFVLQLGDINPYVAVVGTITVLTGILVRRGFPGAPYMLSAMIAGSLLAMGLDHLLGPGVTRIHMLGALPAALPQFSSPDFSSEGLHRILFSALIVTLMGLTEALSIARAIALRSGQRIDANQEFVGQGLSNIAGSFFSCYASSGSFNRSGANFEAGAKTPLAAVFSSVFLLVILVFIAPLVAYLPIAAMAGVLFLVAYGLIDADQIKSIFRTSRPEAVVLLITFAGALIDLEKGIFLGVLVSLMIYLYRTSTPSIRSVVPDTGEGSYHFIDAQGHKECPQWKMVRVNGSIFFGAVDHVRRILEEVDESSPHKRVLLLASGVNFIDIAGAEMLCNEAERRRKLGGGLYFYRVKDEVFQFLKNGPYLEKIGAENIFQAGVRVVDEIYPRLDPDTCRNCEARIFRQCDIVLPNGEPRRTSILAIAPQGRIS
ncbi:MAG: SulP family inorganic anion transporter [Burkholderiales bacterium]